TVWPAGRVNTSTSGSVAPVSRYCCAIRSEVCWAGLLGSAKLSLIRPVVVDAVAAPANAIATQNRTTSSRWRSTKSVSLDMPTRLGTDRRTPNPSVVDGRLLRLWYLVRQPGLVREHHELRAVPGADLDHRAAGVGLRGRRAHE